MFKFLIIYGTKEGQTAKIAKRLGELIRQHGYNADVYDASKIDKTIPIDEYTHIVIGSSVHLLQWSPAVLQFIARNMSHLNTVPSAFFSVSMTAAGETEEQRARIDPLVQKLFDKTGWHPKTVGRFAGAIVYSRYGFFTRLFMQTIARCTGGPTNTSHDIEFTNWEQVTIFEEELINAIESSLTSQVQA